MWQASDETFREGNYVQLEKWHPQEFEASTNFKVDGEEEEEQDEDY